jgi:SAM-dependent methyltransferase
MKKPLSKRVASRFERIVNCFLVENKSGKLLDVPCGKGEISNRLLQNGFQVISSDIAFYIDNTEYTKFLFADLNNKLPFKKGSFNYVACIEGIEHLENPFLLLREMRRVITTGGLIVVSTPNIQNIGSRIRFVLTGGFNYFRRPFHRRYTVYGEHGHINPISFFEMMFILSDSKFKIEKVLTDKCRLGSILLFPLWPIISLITWYFVCIREKDAAQRKENLRLFKSMTSRALMFGSTMIISARAV